MSKVREWFFDAARDGDVPQLKSLLTSVSTADRIDIHADDELAFYYACAFGHHDAARFLVEYCDGSTLRTDVHARSERAFIWAIHNKHFGIALWLIDLCDARVARGLDERPVDIRVSDDEPFRLACARGCTAFAQFLLRLSEARADPIDVCHAENVSFYNACSNGNVDTARWLLTWHECKGKRLDVDVNTPFAVVWHRGYAVAARWLVQRCGASDSPAAKAFFRAKRLVTAVTVALRIRRALRAVMALCDMAPSRRRKTRRLFFRP